jgi:DNA-binding transcriptional LysR family regulator
METITGDFADLRSLCAAIEQGGITRADRLFASPKYLDRYGTPDTPRDLEHHSMFLPARLLGAKSLIFHRGSHSHQVTLSANGMANDFAYLKQMAMLGSGIALVPDFLGKADCQTGQLVRILPQWSIGVPHTLYLLHEGWRLLPAKVRCFRDFISDRFKTFDRDYGDSK